MPAVKLRKIGNSLGIILPANIIKHMNLKENDEIELIEENDGIILSSYDPDFSEWAEAYRNTKQRYKNVLKELAK